MLGEFDILLNTREPTMAESMHRSADVPNFDTYPSSPDDQMGRAVVARSSLEQRAAELGTAAGKIAVIMRQTKEGVENLAHYGIYDRVSGFAENARARAEYLSRLAGARAQELAHAARAKTAELGRQAGETTADLARQAKSGYFRARLRVNQTVREYPVQTAVAAGVVGFLVGVGLRIRRAKRAN
jgi:ElaB/YqjD/DUF883 family membrane-anchored ribosome-binding protein